MKRIVSLIAMGIMFLGAAWAQTATPATPATPAQPATPGTRATRAVRATPATPAAKKRIQHRKANQQRRIGQGVKSGQLTNKEAAKLEKKEANLDRREAKMKASGGKLTKGEKNAISKQQDHLSGEIAKDKHNKKHR